nr:hypothetical protein [Herpetosiphonaceae bacterium]
MMRSTTFWRWLGLLLVNGMLLAALTASTLRPSLNDAWRRADAARQA